jgi:hypothetical protein
MCSFTRIRPPPQQISILAAVATSPNGTEGERAGYCSRSPARQRPRPGDPRGPKGHATAASLLQRRRRHRRRAGATGPTATTSVFTAGQPHAPHDVDQRPARPVCSSITGPHTRRRSLARQPELRDSRRRARRRGGWRPGFSFRGEAWHPSFLSSTGVGEETAGPASSTVTEVRGPVVVLILNLSRSSRSGGKKDGGGADPLQEGGRRLRRARRRRRQKRQHRRPTLAALRPGGGLARPLPALPPAWMGAAGPASSTATGAGAGGGLIPDLHRRPDFGGSLSSGGVDQLLEDGRWPWTARRRRDLAAEEPAARRNRRRRQPPVAAMRLGGCG